MSLGQKSTVDPGAMLTSLLNKREKLRQEEIVIVYELESYLQESTHIGNALKGFEGFLSSSKSSASLRSRKFQPEDRVFSLSSVMSPAVYNFFFVFLVGWQLNHRQKSCFQIPF
ncbi:hypothetical protein EUTSA_v10002280mg [Eutrema salsugineum]|uniref:Chromatin modification-related protein MEAF6 n=1 Tax=Eutrema salsugineum TaxID=72664 RepID=V4MCS1_EUTSA|nr:hypothetical protein EUTSA_v10002280mg [Eutrema salsugineum]